MVFHDGVNLLPELAATGLLSSTLCYFTFSWFVSDKSLKHLHNRLAAAGAHMEIAEIGRRVRFLFNSRDEYDRARARLPPALCVFFNNAALLNEEMFQTGGSRDHDAVYNARANLFKRHELTAEVADKIFIAYDWKYQDYDLEALNPTRLYRNVKGDAVADILRKAKVGLMLSEEEGACYASLEYLLCGLPVVSTPSRGGRDEYYTPENSLICEPTPQAVAAAVRRILDGIAAGAYPQDRVRASALGRMMAFRAMLDDNITASFRALTGATFPRGRLQSCILETNKLWRYRNMRPQKLDDLR